MGPRPIVDLIRKKHRRKTEGENLLPPITGLFD
jgi:hypothetical protein